MNLAFFNGSLEPGRDGVGDYTRRLAQECVRQGNSCCLIALNDRWITEPVRVRDNELMTLRLPAALEWTERIRLARETLSEFQSDWVSLQFVSYAFHPKGMPFGLASRLEPLFAGAKRHIMFHELWIGSHREADVKEKIVGEMQKRIVLGMVKRLKPDAVHTSNVAYAARLDCHTVAAEILPLFSNIPVAAEKGDAWLFPKLNAAGFPIAADNRADFWLFGFFGAIHPVWPPEPLFSRMEEAAKLAKRRVAILAIGRLGAGEALWKDFAAANASRFVFLNLGEQSEERISQYLRSLDYGLATSPHSLIGKSGTAVAMLEHGLPVIVNRDDSQSPPFNARTSGEEPLLIELDENFQKRMMAARLDTPPQSRLPETAAQLLRRFAA